MNPSMIRYSLTFPHAASHLANLHLTAKVEAGETTLIMPVWTPGSYKIRDFPRHLRPLQVSDENGKPLKFTKIRKNRWKITVPEATTINVEYQVYGFEFTVRTNHIDDSHAFISSANTFFYIEGARQQAYEVSVTTPEDWIVTCGITDKKSESPNSVCYRAKDYDELVDSPFLCGDLEMRSYEAGGIPHEIAVYGKAQRGVDEWIEPFTKIIEAEIEFFGSSPLSNYLFQVNLVSDRGGGLEHKDSTVIQFNNQQLRTRKDWLRYLSLIAHEYFHLWNGKRIRPAIFEPFDYEREIYTRSLWVIEGITSYYDERMLRYAQISSVKEYLDMLVAKIKGHSRNPGRFQDNLEEASYDAWIKLYQRNENTVNASTSYYEKGQLVTTLLDLHLRIASKGSKSLDDIMRILWKQHNDANGGTYGEGHVEMLICEIFGNEFEDFFSKYIRGTAELDWNTALQHFGLKLAVKPNADIDLGAFVRPSGPSVILENVLEGGAAHKAGLSARDEIIAINNRKVTRDKFENRLKDFKAGDQVNFQLFRGGELRTVPVALGGGQAFAIERTKQPSESQKLLYEGWLKQEWNKPLDFLAGKD